jgi:hypothetical protein
MLPYVQESIKRLTAYTPNATVKFICHTRFYSVITFSNRVSYMIIRCTNQKPAMTKHEMKIASKCNATLFVFTPIVGEHDIYMLLNYDTIKYELEHHLRKMESICCFKFKYYFYYTRLVNAGEMLV